MLQIMCQEERCPHTHAENGVVSCREAVRAGVATGVLEARGAVRSGCARARGARRHRRTCRPQAAPSGAAIFSMVSRPPDRWIHMLRGDGVPLHAAGHAFCVGVTHMIHGDDFASDRYF